MNEDWKSERERVKAVLEEEDAWNHLAFIYLIHMENSGKYNLIFKKDGTLNRSYNIPRLIAKLRETMGLEPMERLSIPDAETKDIGGRR